SEPAIQEGDGRGDHPLCVGRQPGPSRAQWEQRGADSRLHLLGQRDDSDRKWQRDAVLSERPAEREDDAEQQWGRGWAATAPAVWGGLRREQHAGETSLSVRAIL